jgi:hypothetical protein
MDRTLFQEEYDDYLYLEFEAWDSSQLPSSPKLQQGKDLLGTRTCVHDTLSPSQGHQPADNTSWCVAPEAQALAGAATQARGKALGLVGAKYWPSGRL